MKNASVYDLLTARSNLVQSEKYFNSHFKVEAVPGKSWTLPPRSILYQKKLPRKQLDMTILRNPAPPLFSQVDVSTATHTHAEVSARDEQIELLREVLAAQDRTNELLEDLGTTLVATQRQRANELNQWRNAHPALAGACREAAEALTRVQIDYLQRMTDEINYSSDDMVEGEFVLNEFIDRFGPRLAHLNGVIQVLAQLSSLPNPANSHQS